MLNHTYTSVKNANLVDCGKKQHIPSQPSPLLKDNFLGEFRTELDKKKVLANLGILTDLLLEWEYIKGDIGKSESLIKELDSRTKYISEIDGFQKTIIEGIKYLETVVGGEEKGEKEQNDRLTFLETETTELAESLEILKDYLQNTIEVDIDKLKEDLSTITEKVNNITNLIQVSAKEGNALILEEGDAPGLYVPDLSLEVNTAAENIKSLRTDVNSILDSYVTKEELGGGDFDFVDQDDFDNYVDKTDDEISDIKSELKNTVKTGEDGHVDTLYVNTVSKNNDSGNIKITDSFEVTEGIPLDVRFVVKSLDQLHSLEPSTCYPGMGVVVSNQASLYILREPVDGIINEDYIKDNNSWKCPEDLVIEVLTQEEYDKKLKEGAINPNLFYYIYEEIDKEPNPDLYEGGVESEEYKQALERWLKYLQGQYMSAVWGQEIETLVASKASNTAIKSLEIEIQKLTDLINSLSGGTDEINLKNLNDQVLQNKSDIQDLTKEGGSIPTLEKGLSDLQNTVTSNYVTKESITVENPDVDYIFVKKTEFEAYETAHKQAIANQVITQQIETDSIVLGEDTLVASESTLLFNNEKVALNKQVPLLEIIDKDTFDSKEDIDEDTYYMVYDEDERYISESEFSEYKTSQAQAINAISQFVTKNQTYIGELTTLNTDNKNSLVLAINELVTKITTLTNAVQTLEEQVNSTEAI